MSHSHWMTAVLGLQYLKEGLQCFCDDVVEEVHATLKENFDENCNKCILETLKPDHKCEDKRCPLGCQNCNCRKTNTDLIPCSKHICGAIYDGIIMYHGSTPPAPNWKNTDISQWCTNPWAIATCFIPTTGYFNRTCGAEFDCSGLLLLIINCKAFLQHLDCNIDGKDAFSQTYEIRNKLFHSPSSGLRKEEANEYIDDMIKVLKDKRELVKRRESIKAVEKLIDLKNKGIDCVFDVKTISSVIETDPQQLITYLKEKLTSLELETSSKQDHVIGQKRKQEKQETDEEISLQDLASQVRSMSSEVASLAEGREIRVAEDFESGQGVSETIETDAKQTLRILVVQVEALNLEIKKLKEADSREKRLKYTSYKMPTIKRPRDGKLITLEKDEVRGLLQHCDKNVVKGGFGDVHITRTKVPGLDVRVAIKKIVCGKEDQMKMLSVSNEKIASRVMHFAIVPLIAYMDEELADNKRAFYFISPYFENGSLLEVIAKDKQRSNIKDIHLNSLRRKRIIYQTASALDYLHTPVPGSRGIVLHMDLTSTNIVLDQNWNARLIDFGLAREMNEGQSTATQTQSKKFGKRGYLLTDNYSKLRVYDEYYNFGVVIRELLTGMAPYIENEPELKDLRENIIEIQLQNNIWEDEKEALDLIKLSTKCLESKKDKNVCSAYIVNVLKKMFQSLCSIHDACCTSTCDLCIVNPAVEPKKAPEHRCTQRINVCTSCMRNSHVNPIRCPTCNKTVFPKIGHTYAAILIAGNDVDNVKLATSFKTDVLAFKDVLSSKCPCVIGIRDENIKMVVPSTPGMTDELKSQAIEAFSSLGGKKDLGTLLVYFTGHHISGKGFTLGGPRDILQLTEIQEEIENIYKQWGKTARILMFLDCCRAPFVLDIQKLHGKVIQMNACRPDEICHQPASGSTFMKFFCQALTRRAYNKNCYNSSKSETTCADCVMSGDIITVDQLLRNISQHMKKCFGGSEPILHMHCATSDDSCIGYNVDFTVNLNFIFKAESGQNLNVVIKDKMFCDIKSLKKHILEIVLADETTFDENLKLTPVKFADAVALYIHDGSQHGRELRSMESVSWALDGKREIVACYRTIQNVLKGSVVVFSDTTYITEYLNSKGILLEQANSFDANGVKVEFSHNEFSARYKEMKKEVDNLSCEMSEDRKVALRRFRDELLKVIVKWNPGQPDDTSSRKLTIFFPYLPDNKWHDFMLVDLSECTNT